MRTEIKKPDHIRTFTEYLRDAGYYCCTHGKFDYQFTPSDKTWHMNNRFAHWKNRPDPDQPFYAVYNYVTTHQGRTQRDVLYAKAGGTLPDSEKTDPAKVRVPAFLPDTPLSRKLIARTYDNITFTKKEMGKRIDELEETGVADRTIIIVTTDHGDGGLPRAKEYLYDSGLRVPFIMFVPPALQVEGLPEPGGKIDRLCNFADFAPTILSLAGVSVPGYMQGYVMVGKNADPEPEWVYATRDRGNTRYDTMRALHSKQYLYIRHLRPYLPHYVRIRGFEHNPVMQEIRALHGEGKLSPEVAQFVQPIRPAEELFDSVKDPDNVHNLADDPQYAEVLKMVREKMRSEIARIGDTGFIPEGMLHTFRNKVMMPYYDRYNAQAWVGDLYKKPHSVDYFLEHVRATGKRFAELQRYQREVGRNNGYMLFANNTWVQHVLTKSPADWKPFPVYYAVQDSLSPVLVAMRTPQYVFTPDTPSETKVYVVNDDAQGRNLKKVTVKLEILGEDGKVYQTEEWPMGHVDYYSVIEKEVRFSIPAAALAGKERNALNLRLTASNGSGEMVSENTYPVEVVDPNWTLGDHAALQGKSIIVDGCSQGIIDHLYRIPGLKVLRSTDLRPDLQADLILVGPRSTAMMNRDFAKTFLKPGGRLLVLEPRGKIALWMPGTGLRADEAPMEAIVRNAGGEFVEMRGYEEQPLFSGLKPMDWKWWFRDWDESAILLTCTYQFEEEPEDVALLGHYLRPHSYWHPISRIHQSYKENRSFPVVAKKEGWGEIVATELMIDDCIATDPRSARTLTNLLVQPIQY